MYLGMKIHVEIAIEIFHLSLTIIIMNGYKEKNAKVTGIIWYKNVYTFYEL